MLCCRSVNDKLKQDFNQRVYKYSLIKVRKRYFWCGIGANPNMGSQLSIIKGVQGEMLAEFYYKQVRNS